MCSVEHACPPSTVPHPLYLTHAACLTSWSFLFNIDGEFAFSDGEVALNGSSVYSWHVDLTLLPAELYSALGHFRIDACVHRLLLLFVGPWLFARNTLFRFSLDHGSFHLFVCQRLST